MYCGKDILKNEEFLKELKFDIGDGNLQYYLYNWRCALRSKKVLSKRTAVQLVVRLRK